MTHTIQQGGDIMQQPTYAISDTIIDQDGRRGTVTWAWSPDDQRYDNNTVWVRPSDTPYKTKHDIPGIGSQITIAATAWRIQGDGTLLGDWFDRRFGEINNKVAHKEASNSEAK
jgi:hypothetical protein